VIRNINYVDPVIAAQPMGFKRSNPRELAL